MFIFYFIQNTDCNTSYYADFYQIKLNHGIKLMKTA